VQAAVTDKHALLAWDMRLASLGFPCVRQLCEWDTSCQARGRGPHPQSDRHSPVRTQPGVERATAPHSWTTPAMGPPRNSNLAKRTILQTT